MLKIFRNDIFLQAVIILVVTAALWLDALMYPQSVLLQGGGYLFCLWAGRLSPLAATLTAIGLLLVEGYLFNMILYRHRLANKGTLMPMLFFIVAMSLGPQQLTFTPMLAGSLFLILTIDQMLLYDGTLLALSLSNLFGASACLGLATLCCPSMVVFLLPMLVTIINYSQYGWRNWIMVVLGLLAPYVVLETYFYMSDQSFYRNYLLLYDLTDLHLRTDGRLVDWGGSLLFTLLLVFGLAALIVDSQSKVINYKKNTTVVSLFILGGVAMMAYNLVVPMPTQAYAIPFACCATALFYEKKRMEWLWNLLLLVVIALFVAWNLL